MTYFDSFGVEHIPKEMKNCIDNKNIMANIFKTQADVLLMCGYFGIEFIVFMFKDKALTDFTNLFLLKVFEKNDKVILNNFEIKHKHK